MQYKLTWAQTHASHRTVNFFTLPLSLSVCKTACRTGVHRELSYVVTVMVYTAVHFKRRYTLMHLGSVSFHASVFKDVKSIIKTVLHAFKLIKCTPHYYFIAVI